MPSQVWQEVATLKSSSAMPQGVVGTGGARQAIKTSHHFIGCLVAQLQFSD
jgi:hypothetical protein